jgi:hypothetical protein
LWLFSITIDDCSVIFVHFDSGTNAANLGLVKTRFVKPFDDLCLVHVIFDVLKLSSNLESLFSFKFSAEQKSDLKEYKSLLLSFEALSLDVTNW